MKRSRRPTAVAALGAALVLTATAFAAQTNFDAIDLLADGGDAKFQYGFDYGCADGTSASSGDHVYSIEGGSLVASMQTDAFDGALALYVGDSPFALPGNTADFTNGNEVQSPTVKLEGLKVSRNGASFPGSPTLRELIKFQNKSKKTVKARVMLSSEFGSDDQTIVISSSSGDSEFNRRDRWGVTTDDLIAPADPAVTLVNYGKGKVLKPDQQIGPYSTPDDGVTVDGSDCAQVGFPLKLKAKQTGYLMFFLEMHEYPGTAVADVLKKFEKKHLNATLLTDISESVRKKILNWDVG